MDTRTATSTNPLLGRHPSTAQHIGHQSRLDDVVQDIKSNEQELRAVRRKMAATGWLQVGMVVVGFLIVMFIYAKFQK